MPDNTPETQSLLPVTADEDRCDICCRPREQHVGRDLQCDTTTYFRPMPPQSRSLPGDVGLREALEKAEAAQLNLVRRGVHFRNAGIKQAAALIEELSKRPSTTWGEVKTAILALVDEEPTFGDVECPQCARAALTPSALSGDNSQSSSNAGGVEPWPGCYADLQQRRVTTLAKLGLMLSVMASGEAAEVVGYDAADLYAEVLMALAIEDADDTDIALEEARDHPDSDIMAVQAKFEALASLSTPEPMAPYASDGDLIEAAVQAALDAGLAENGVHGVAAARHAARFVVESREYWRNIERANLADEVRQIKEAKQGPATPTDVSMNLAAAFGPILKEAFPEYSALHRHAAGDALAKAVVARGSWFSPLSDLHPLGQEYDGDALREGEE